MRSFVHGMPVIARVPGSVTRLLSTADVGRGLEGLHRSQMPGLLVALAERSRVASVKASSALEGIIVPDERRADRIIRSDATRLRTRSEQELAGYRDALDYIWRENWSPVNTGRVLHLHRLLLSRTATPGGNFKTDDNLVVDRHPDGSQAVRFRPVPARQTPSFTDDLMQAYAAERQADLHHPLLLIGLAILDLLVIHPFDDGNGRVARILTNALLSEAGYGVARYVSLEEQVARTADDHYAALLASTHGWHEGEHDPWPWLTYFVRQVGTAYDAFAADAAASGGGRGKRSRVKLYVLDQAPARFSISDVRAALPGVSDGTIRNALDELREQGRVRVEGTGRGATWLRP